MKKNFFLSCLCVITAGFSHAQIVSDAGFDGATGTLESPNVAPSWYKGCANNTLATPAGNNPVVTSASGNNFLRLSGSFTPGYGFNMSSAAQDIAPLSSGEYVLTFDSKNQVQSSSSTGLKLMIELKNYQGCSWLNPQPTDQVMTEFLEVPMGSSFNQYSVTFCIPQSLNNVMNTIEFGGTPINPTSNLSDGNLDIDNVVLTKVNRTYDLAFDYDIDCLTGIVKVKPNSALSPDLYDMFILVENNPNDPNNQSDAGDVTHDQIAWWGYNVDAQGWYTFSAPLDQGKNYYIKRGIWGDCMSWVEARKFNVELTPDQFNGNFTYSITCNENLESKLTVTGANQQGKNPHHMFILIQYFPGTNNPEQQIETINWWQQSNASNYQYQQGPFTFNHVLTPGAHYYVKRGVWDACTPWAETRQYNIVADACDPSGMCDMYITSLQPPCWDMCGGGEWFGEFQISPNSVCYNAIDYVVFNTVNNYPFGPTFTDYTAPYSVPYCTSGNYYVTATIHYLNGTTSTASYYQQGCFQKYPMKSALEDTPNPEEISLYPNPATDVLNIETDAEFDVIQVYSAEGKLIETYTEKQIDVSQLENGYYFINVVKDGTVLNTEPFNKQ